MRSKIQLNRLEKATQDDARWFEKHPDRRYRIRKFMPGEAPLPPTPPRHRRLQGWTLLKQLAPGMRARTFIDAPEGFVPFDSDENVADLFGYALNPPPQDQRFGVDTRGGKIALDCFLPLSPKAVARDDQANKSG
jgi:hypothetical protein